MHLPADQASQLPRSLVLVLFLRDGLGLDRGAKATLAKAVSTEEDSGEVRDGVEGARTNCTVVKVSVDEVH